jgi:2-methylcitrate dehydratase PrpD
MDDGHRFASLHPGTVVIPAAIATAEMIQASTRDLIAGVVVGYEVMIRIGMGINPSSLQRGFHTTGTVGTFGAAAAAANIMKLGHEETISALGLAGLQGAGLLQVNHELKGAEVKPLNPAKATASGLLSAILAQAGARGPVDILEGPDGFIKAMADGLNERGLTSDLGQRFEISNVYTKFYAACHHAHASIDAALEICRDAEVDIAGVRGISVETYPIALRLAGIAHPTTPSAARFSIPFSVALALTKKDASAVAYSEESVRDDGIQSLAEKVQLLVSRKWEKLYPDKRGATVTITDNKNRAWSAEVELAKGEPENPGSEEDIRKKFYANATLLHSDKVAKLLGDSIMSLEKVSLENFVKLI